MISNSVRNRTTSNAQTFSSANCKQWKPNMKRELISEMSSAFLVIMFSERLVLWCSVPCMVEPPLTNIRASSKPRAWHASLYGHVCTTSASTASEKPIRTIVLMNHQGTARCGAANENSMSRPPILYGLTPWTRLLDSGFLTLIAQAKANRELWPQDGKWKK